MKVNPCETCIYKLCMRVLKQGSMLGIADQKSFTLMVQPCFTAVVSGVHWFTGFICRIYICYNLGIERVEGTGFATQGVNQALPHPSLNDQKLVEKPCFH